MITKYLCENISYLEEVQILIVDNRAQGCETPGGHAHQHFRVGDSPLPPPRKRGSAENHLHFSVLLHQKVRRGCANSHWRLRQNCRKNSSIPHLQRRKTTSSNFIFYIPKDLCASSLTKICAIDDFSREQLCKYLNKFGDNV